MQSLLTTLAPDMRAQYEAASAVRTVGWLLLQQGRGAAFFWAIDFETPSSSCTRVEFLLTVTDPSNRCSSNTGGLALLLHGFISLLDPLLFHTRTFCGLHRTCLNDQRFLYFGQIFLSRMYIWFNPDNREKLLERYYLGVLLNVTYSLGTVSFSL